MSDILSRVENLESKSIQELSLSQKTTNWLELPSSFLLKEITDGLQLRNSGITKSFHIVFHVDNGLICFITCICDQ